MIPLSMANTKRVALYGRGDGRQKNRELRRLFDYGSVPIAPRQFTSVDLAQDRNRAGPLRTPGVR